MRLSVHLVLVVLTAFSLAGCNRLTAPREKKFTAQDMQAARKAIPLTEVSLMLRSGYGQQAIIQQIEHRHIPAKPDARTEQSLVKFGASPLLIRALKSDANLLTRDQRGAFDQLTAEREEQRAQSERTTEQDRADFYALDQEVERKRKQQLADQTLKNAESMQDRVTMYDKAMRDYVRKKSQIEYNIAVEQSRIDAAKGRGANDESLSVRYEALEKYKQQLADLKEPTR